VKNKYGIQKISSEADFHDRWASEINEEEIDVISSFTGSTSPENRYLISFLGNLQGKRILELGCGAGENSIYFALQGANVTATDISEGMLEKTNRLAKKYGVKIDTHKMDAMNITFENDAFDVVYAANTLHHVDTPTAIHEIHRVLKPGGFMCTWDPLCHNPIINIYRRMATKVRTIDEHPLSINIIDSIRAKFSHLDYETFWFFSLWIFLRFYLIEKIHPNDQRYWKKIVLEEKRLRPLYYKLERFDLLVKKIPFVKRFGWNIALAARK